MKRSTIAILAVLVMGAALSGCAQATVPPPPAAPAAPVVPVGPATPAAPAASLAGTTAVVFRSPSCDCCHQHEAYMEAAGIEVHSVIEDNLAEVKKSFGLPLEMQSCHTTAIDRYFVEGHVPMSAIEKLLAEMPNLDGIALPGMPAGSPGMGGIKQGPLTVFGIRDGEVVEVFGDF
jgi:hypothetical protein